MAARTLYVVISGEGTIPVNYGQITGPFSTKARARRCAERLAKDHGLVAQVVPLFTWHNDKDEIQTMVYDRMLDPHRLRREAKQE